MPAPEISDLHQDAILWMAEGNAGDYGERKVAPPEDIKVRWTTKRMDTLDRLGNTIALDAMAVVDRPIVIGSKMKLGRLEYLGPGTDLSGEDEDLMTVVTYSEVPDIRGREFRRTVGLKRHRDTLPEQSA